MVAQGWGRHVGDMWGDKHMTEGWRAGQRWEVVGTVEGAVAM